MRFATYNLLDLALDSVRSHDQLERFERAAEVIAGLNADVVAVQEIVSEHPAWAGECLGRLAGLAGMSATVTAAWQDEEDAQSASYAIGPGGHRYHVGLMWKPHLRLVPGSYRAWGKRDFWHSLVRVVLVGEAGVPVQYASYHARPFGRHARADDAERVVAALTRPAGSAPVMLGADANCISADRRPDGTFYERDWYADTPWRSDYIHQCRWECRDGVRHHWADRQPGDVFYGGGLYDAAAVLDAAWEPSSGHWPTDPFGARRVDTIRVSSALTAALRTIEVARTDLALAASDHLPVVLTYDEMAIASYPTAS